MSETNQIVEMIGPENFEWLSREFNEKTRLKDVPEAILESAASVDISTRNYASHANALTTIALITFAYKMAGKAQKAHYGAKDIVLLKVLAKGEKARREGKSLTPNDYWDEPLFALISGEVGDRIRATRMMNSPS